MQKLTRDFFHRHCVEVAQDLLGKILVFGSHQGIITETEAYRGEDDPASHAYRGITPRTRVMFGAPGFSYVYLIYGMYHCLNVVTEAEGQPAAVLIRGLKLDTLHLDGPGKLCRQLGLTLAHNGIDLMTEPNFYLVDNTPTKNFSATTRIGIKKAKEKLWRFVSTN
ncbi:MAG: DNA-3-methyladenine glycosylase [Gammaproteobacteria bacterium]